MKASLNHVVTTLVIIVLLIAGNVYQFYNPRIIEVPEYIQTEIDSTAWVQRSAYLSRGMLIDSLSAENKKLSERVSESRDQIANLTTITGKLNLQVDSLQKQLNLHKLDFSLLPYLAEKPEPQTYITPRIFGDNLFKVMSEVTFTPPNQMHNRIEIEQLRGIRLTVATTISSDHSRILTYVTSEDFETLEYETYTELSQKRLWPWFTIGLGVGAAGILFLN